MSDFREVDQGNPEQDKRMAEWTTKVYDPAVKIIAQTLMERNLPLGPSGAERAARAILARLSAADPPIAIELLSDDD
jgi:hypothetical protein